MDEAFIIIQIGNPEMDAICDEVIVPAIQAAGLLPRRVDRDESGDLMKAEIVAFLQHSQIIIADITNERPNCYLEVGYAMGLGKKRNLIITCREDHHSSSKKFDPSGKKVHFDLEGYHLLLWDPNNLEKYKSDLIKSINQRLAILAPNTPDFPTSITSSIPPIDEEWLSLQREGSTAGLTSLGFTGYMEAVCSISPKGNWSQKQLLDEVRAAQVRNSGWPIGLILNRDGFRPYPTPDGVTVEARLTPDDSVLHHNSYDYWNLRRTGDFYLKQNLIEDVEGIAHTSSIFFDTRITRVTELLLFLSRLYNRMDILDSTQILVQVTHGGIGNRILTAANPARQMTSFGTTGESMIASFIVCTLGDLEINMVEHVKSLLQPLFVLFDFQEFDDQVWHELINGFLSGGR